MGRHPARLLPKKLDGAGLEVEQADTVFRIVDLPAPLAPDEGNNLPSCTS